MRVRSALLLGVCLLADVPQTYAPFAAPIAGPNDNRKPAGSTSSSGLTLSLEARRVMWYPDGDSLRGRSTEAFGEAGKAATVPGPLVRVRAGTPVRINLRNVDIPDTLRFMFSTLLTSDTVVIPPGASGEVRYTPTKPGNYYYRAFASDTQSAAFAMKGLLAGAFIVDSANAGPPNDRVLVLSWLVDSLNADKTAPNFNRMVFAINGRSWPHTERFSATVGDSIHWRVINLNTDVHPLHLHGVYYRVDDFNGTPAQVANTGAPGRMVVTERMPALTTMSITWSPEREGNWLFHCHFAFHLVPPRLLEVADSMLLRPPREEHGVNHALHNMAGLVIGIIVKPRRTPVVQQSDLPRRHLRLVAFADPGFPDTLPSFRFRLEEVKTGARTEARPGFSPPIILQRNEPVSITVVNNLPEETSVHWHGIELESYYDGVAHFGGVGKRISPMIAPRDSFEALFTPPRSGTFIYHSHVNEVRQQAAGLVGALIVRDGTAPLGNDHTFFLKAARRNPGNEVEINGQVDPDTLVLRAGVPTRLRFIGLTAFNPSATVFLTARSDSVFRNFADSLVVQWTPLAKDGYDLEARLRVPRRARQVVSMGETFDYEFTPAVKGRMLLEVRGNAATATLIARVPIRVE